MMKKILLLIILSLYQHIALAQAINVSVERLGDLHTARELRAPASVLSANRTVVTSEVTALISKVLVDVGAAVEKGELLVQLDKSNARLSLQQVRTSLDALDAQIVQAKRRLTKAEGLSAKNFVSDDELIDRQTDLDVLQANRNGQLVAIQVADLALSRTLIHAPFDATVVQRSAQIGNFAQPGTRLLTLVQKDLREVDAELDPRYALDIPRISKLRYLSLGQQYPLEFLRLSDVIETDTRKIRARFRFTKDVAPIGSSGVLAWTEPTAVVPVSLIVQRGTGFGVFVAMNGKAEFVEIPSAQEGRPAAVDLPDDTLIISRGHLRLQDGDELIISE
jgi:RND family efflux transporter MFP subunit